MSTHMVLAHSKVTSQGQISVPASVRQRLGIGPGAVLQWDDLDGTIVVRRLGRFTSADVRTALFGEHPQKARSNAELKQGIRRKMKEKHGGG